jgi:RNA polymerase-interacting CarD/CdnL/TRCF family regulator
MTVTAEKYDLGDWIVHQHYGMGQIKKTEIKPMHGEKVECYRVQTKDGVFWFPADQDDNPRIRPVASRERLKQGLEILNKPPRNFDADYKEVKKRINEVKDESSILSMARLLRDLSARSAVKKLNDLEGQTLRSFTIQFLKEWTMCMEISPAAAQEQLESILQKSRDRANNN